jgi:hypothetical protein
MVVRVRKHMQGESTSSHSLSGFVNVLPVVVKMESFGQDGNHMCTVELTSISVGHNCGLTLQTSDASSYWTKGEVLSGTRRYVQY